MDEAPDVSQASVLGIGGVPHERGDPRPVGLGADARDRTAAAGPVNQDQPGEAGQAAWRPDLDREAGGGGAHVPGGRETLPPGRALLAFGGGFSAARLAHVGDGAPRDLMPEVAEGTPNTGVAPLAVLGGHPDDEPAGRVHAPWAARSATAAAVVCPRDQLSRPAEEGIGRDQGVQVTASPSPEALGVGEPEPARTELLSEDAMLFLERVKDVTRLLVDPARDGHDEALTTRGEQATDGASRAEALGGHARRDPASVQRRISPSDGVDRVLGQYGIRSEAAFAKLCGACPIPASSGMTTGRHRLNRGGHRHANAALYRAVIIRMRYHQPTVDYVARRTADGRTKREIIRCLKRFLAREIYQRVMTDFRARQEIIQAA